MDDPKALIGRGALERVLARAAELQGASGSDEEPHESLTESQLMDLGKEVGISPEHLRQALAEERMRVPAPEDATDFTSRVMGAASIAAQRVVPGAADRVLATLDRWMQREQWLQVVRQRSDRISWEPRPGIIGAIKRVLESRSYALHRATKITAAVVSLENNRTLVRLEADFRLSRRATVSQTGAGAVVGSASTGLLLLLNVMAPVAIAPAVVFTAASFAGARRAHRRALERGLLTLEQVLDRLERGDTQAPSLLRLIESAIPPAR